MTVLNNIYEALRPNYSAITVEDLYHPNLIAVYSVYCDVILVISSILFIFILYTILTKSTKEMKDYKYYLVHQLCWSFIFDVHLGGWKPVTLWPFYLGYSVGWYSELPKTLAIFPFIGMVFVSVGMGFSLYISVLHRYVHAAPFSWFFRKYSNLTFRMINYTIIFVLLQSVLSVPLYNIRNNSDDVRAAVIENANYMSFFYDKYPNIFGFFPDLDGGDAVLYAVATVSALALVLLSIVVLYLNYIRILNKNKSNLSVVTYKMQRLLFKTLCIQLSLAIVMLIIPITSCLVLTIFNVRWVSTYSICMFMLITNHAVVDFFTTIYFIKPYRSYTMEFINSITKVFGFELFKQTHTVITFNSTVIN